MRWSDVRRRIVVVGATGRVGRQVAAELAGTPRVVLVGRHADRLQAVAGAADLPSVVADLDGLGGVLHAGDVLLSLVGPYDLVGDRVVTAALEANATYVDVAAEAAFLRRVHDVHGPVAAQRGVLLLPAAGYEGVPGHLVGHDAVNAAGADAHALQVAYLTEGVGSALARGGRALARSLSRETTTFHRGHMVREHVGARRRSVVVGGVRHHTASIGGAEVFSLPHHHPSLMSVDVHAGWFGPLAPAVGWSARLATPFRMVGGDRVVDEALRVVGVGPVAALADGISRVVADVRDAAGVVVARREAVGGDPVVMTARLAAAAADRLARADVRDLPTGTSDPLAVLGRDGLADLCSFAGLVTT